jgi:ketosteroid isomerase-like protein
VVVVCRDRGVGKGSGIEVSRVFGQLWTLRDAKVVAFAAYPDRESAVAAARGA